MHFNLMAAFFNCISETAQTAHCPEYTIRIGASLTRDFSLVSRAVE